MKFTIDIRILKGMKQFITKDVARYVLTGVSISVPENHEHKAIIAATDGRLIGLYNYHFTDPIEGFGDIVLPVDWLRFFGTTPSPKVQITTTDKTFTVEKNGVAYVGKLIEGTFPKWRGVIPTEPFKPIDCYSLNADYLNRFCVAWKAMGQVNDRNMRLYGHQDSLGPVSVFCSDRQFYGVIMPVRYADHAKVPDWAKPPVVVVPTAPTPAAPAAS